jgi:translation initiation factor IF-3
VDDKARVNDEITDAHVYLVDADGTQVGLTSLSDALALLVDEAVTLSRSSRGNSPPCAG